MAIRTHHADFVVTERLTNPFTSTITPTWSPAYPHALYALNKTALTTPDAISWLAKALSVKPGSIDYAGLKDKYAQTLQHITLPIAGGTANVLPKHPAGEQWSASLLGFSPTPIDASSILGNHFAITIRGLTKHTSDEMTRRARRLTDDAGTLLFTNYFGNQRFGSNRHGQGWAARKLIDGDFAEALRLLIATPARKDSGKTRTFTRLCAQHWGDRTTLAASLPATPHKHAIDALAKGATPREAFTKLPAFLQQMALEAFQSILWNDTARRLVAPIPNVLKTNDDFGPLLFPPAKALHAPPCAGLLDLQLPMLACSTTLADPWAEAAREALAEHDLTLKQLTIPGLRRPSFGEALRPLLARADNFSLSPPEPENPDRPNSIRRVATFNLPRGSYATVLMRALGQ
ncbi:MAG: tRNA pseudouridine(13) synthase TruD [bacterium]